MDTVIEPAVDLHCKLACSQLCYVTKRPDMSIREQLSKQDLSRWSLKDVDNWNGIDEEDIAGIYCTLFPGVYRREAGDPNGVKVIDPVVLAYGTSSAPPRSTPLRQTNRSPHIFQWIASGYRPWINKRHRGSKTSSDSKPGSLDVISSDQLPAIQEHFPPSSDLSSDNTSSASESLEDESEDSCEDDSRRLRDTRAGAVDQSATKSDQGRRSRAPSSPWNHNEKRDPPLQMPGDNHEQTHQGYFTTASDVSYSGLTRTKGLSGGGVTNFASQQRRHTDSYPDRGEEEIYVQEEAADGSKRNVRYTRTT